MRYRLMGVSMCAVVALASALTLSVRERVPRASVPPDPRDAAEWTSADRHDVAPSGTPAGAGFGAASIASLAVPPVVAAGRAAPRKAAAPSALGLAGMVVAIDPATGALISPERKGPSGPLSTEQLQALARDEAEGLITVRHADGSESIDHEGRFAEHGVIRVRPDGRLHFECVHGTFGVPLALDRRRPVTPSLEEE